MSVLELKSKYRKSTRDKANISNPTANRGCAPLTANRISADCVQISLGPSIPCIPLGVCHTEGLNAMSSNGNIFRIADLLCGEFTGHKGQWRGDLMFSLICAWINGWVNNREADDLRRHRAHYYVTVMLYISTEIYYWGPRNHSALVQLMLKC